MRSPVFIPTLNRFEHFARCIDTLSNCDGADETVLYIGLDFPSSDKHWQGYRKITEFLPAIRGFLSVEIIRHERNVGAVGNFITCLGHIFARHDTIILSEDDNAFSPTFLNFMNGGLERYRDNDRIYSISGYHFPVDLKPDYSGDIYTWGGFSAWGVGLWRSKYLGFRDMRNNDVERNKLIQKYLFDLNSLRTLYRLAPSFLPTLLSSFRTGRIYGDNLVTLYMLDNNLMSVFPTVSLVRNFGHDGSGVHGRFMEDNPYLKQEIQNGNSVQFSEINEASLPIVWETLYRHFRMSTKSELKFWLLWFMALVGHGFKKNFSTK